MTSLKEKFLDATKIPIGETLNSKQEDFEEVFNEIFGFHDSQAISSNLSFKNRNLEMLINYIAKWKEVDRRIYFRWRKLLLRLDGIDFIYLGNRDPEFPIGVYRVHNVGLINMRNSPPKILRKLAKRYYMHLKGAELNAITAKKYNFMGFPKVRVKFDWLTARSGTWVPEKVECSDFSLQFISEVRDKKW